MTGPFLYDDEPAPLHTGTPRNRQGYLVAALVALVLLAFGMVAALYLVKGSPEEQAEEVTGVFLAALEQGDSETAHELLCEAERAELLPEDVASTYLPGTTSRVVGTETSGSGSERLVRVRWADGETAAWTVVSENGPRICGVAVPD